MSQSTNQNKKAEPTNSEEEAVDSKEERIADLSISSRDRLRKQLEDEVAAFLANGGEINKVDPNVTADPPQKPQNNYCSRPI